MSAEDFLEKYQELEVLGHGGFATVFSGIRIKDSFPVWLLTFAFHRSSVYSCLYFSNPENVFNAGGNQTCSTAQTCAHNNGKRLFLFQQVFVLFQAFSGIKHKARISSVHEPDWSHSCV